MEQWRQHLQDYLVTKNKARDLVSYINYLNVELTAMLQDIRGFIEIYDNFSVDLPKRRYNELLIFPLQSTSFLIKYINEPLVQYDFYWLMNKEVSEISLGISVINHCHRRFDSNLIEMIGEIPVWLENCEFCDPYNKDLGPADDLKEDTLKWFIIDCFVKMTTDYLV